MGSGWIGKKMKEGRAFGKPSLQKKRMATRNGGSHVGEISTTIGTAPQNQHSREGVGATEFLLRGKGGGEKGKKKPTGGRGGHFLERDTRGVPWHFTVSKGNQSGGTIPRLVGCKFGGGPVQKGNQSGQGDMQIMTEGIGAWVALLRFDGATSGGVEEKRCGRGIVWAKRGRGKHPKTCSP